MSILALTSLTSPPPALTSSELATISISTPTTFEGIAPLLRHKEDLVELTIDPPFEGFSGGKGSLFITEGAVSFFSPSTSTGISIPYPLITLHAISRAPLKPFSAPGEESSSTGGGPCIYCQIDESEGAEESMDDEGNTTREVIIVPGDATHLDKIFETLSTCAALHPPSSSDSSFFGLDPSSTIHAGNVGEFGIEQMTAEEESDMMSSVGRAARNHLEEAMSWSIPKPVVEVESETVEESVEVEKEEVVGR